MDASGPSGGILLPDLLTLCRTAQSAADDVFTAARRRVTDMCSENGKVSGPLVDANQVAAHGLSWLATYVEGLRQMLGWAERLEGAGQFGEMEQLMVQAAFGEYLAQIRGGIALSQVEIVRPADMGLTEGDMTPLDGAAAKTLIAGGNTPALRARMGEIMAEGHFGALGLDDEMLDMCATSSTSSSRIRSCPMPMNGIWPTT